MHEVAPLSSLIDAPEDLWYQPEEFQDMYERMYRVALYHIQSQQKKYHQQQKQSNHKQRKQRKPRKVCNRGLEPLIEGRSSRKDEARDCVLTVQQLSRDEGRLDEDDMALIYKSKSKVSLAVARERGLKDAEAVAEYLER